MPAIDQRACRKGDLHHLKEIRELELEVVNVLEIGAIKRALITRPSNSKPTAQGIVTAGRSACHP